MPPAIRLVTPIPGPSSQMLMERRNRSVPRGVAHASPVFAASAEGARVRDVDGNVFLDFAGGIGTMNVGHANPQVVEAATEQLRRMTHTCFSVAPYESYVALAETLNRITPGTHEKKTLLVNSGAEALENAVKIARHATGRDGVAVFEHAFHGRTLLTMSMTSKVAPYKDGFGPFAPEVYRLPFPCVYRSVEPPDEARYAREIETFFAANAAPERTACVVLELVLGEGGFHVAPPEYVRALEKFCHARGILLVADEVQTGFGRTGRMFASEHYGLVPDLVTMAKSLAGGLPLSAVTGRAEFMDHPQVGGLGGTFAGNPVACAAAIAAVSFMETARLAQRAEAIGRVVARRFDEMKGRHACIGDARGLGAMRALEIVKDRSTKEPDKEKTNRILEAAWRAGLLLVGAGTFGNVVRTLMPLVITDDELNEGLDVLEKAFA